MSDEMAWPRKGSKAFSSTSDGKHFYLSDTPWAFPQKPEAFRIAAETVINNCQDIDPLTCRDELFFPVAFLYRHGLELLLKDIVRTGVQMNFFEREDVEDALANHNLARLWTQAKRLLVDRWPGADPEPLKAAEAVINEFHQADPNGQLFRYNEDKSGRRYRHETLPKRIGLDELRETMASVFNFLDSIASCLRDDLANMLYAARERYT